MQTSEKNRQPFVELVDAHQGILHRICSVYGKGMEEQQDLFQEMVLQLWQSYASFRGQSTFTTWMYRVALNTALLERRNAARRPDESLTTLVRRQLRFFHTTFEWWLWTWALTVWMVSFCVPVWVENQGGGYRIDHVVEFVAVSAGLVFGSYALFRLGHYPMVRRSLATLHDLEAQITEQTERVRSLRKYWTIGTVLLVIALAGAVVWTFKVWLSATP